MKYFDFTLPTPAENLACDEALLGLCEEGGEEVLRFWEPREPFVVVGYANRAAREVNLAACRERGIPVLRRCSGGGTVVQGAGCLNYSVILRIGGEGSRGTESIGSTNGHVLARNQAAVKSLVNETVEIQGHTDLAVNGRKFSGNAQRRLRSALIFHGTFLLNFDLGLIEQVLPLPSQEPEYRRGRAHGEFVTNLNLPAAEVKAAMRKVWGAEEEFKVDLSERARELVAEKYGSEKWNGKF